MHCAGYGLRQSPGRRPLAGITVPAAPTSSIKRISPVPFARGLISSRSLASLRPHLDQLRHQHSNGLQHRFGDSGRSRYSHHYRLLGWPVPVLPLYGFPDSCAQAHLSAAAGDIRLIPSGSGFYPLPLPLSTAANPQVGECLMVLPRKWHQWRVACYENACARYFWKTDEPNGKAYVLLPAGDAAL